MFAASPETNQWEHQKLPSSPRPLYAGPGSLRIENPDCPFNREVNSRYRHACHPFRNDEVLLSALDCEHVGNQLPRYGQRGPISVSFLHLPVANQRQVGRIPGASLAASTSIVCRCLFLCLEIGVRITLSAELFSALHSPQ